MTMFASFAMALASAATQAPLPTPTPTPTPTPDYSQLMRCAIIYDALAEDMSTAENGPAVRRYIAGYEAARGMADTAGRALGKDRATVGREMAAVQREILAGIKAPIARAASGVRCDRALGLKTR